jgi:hypothetical protein
MILPDSLGYAAVYHAYDPETWDGPEGFYGHDNRGPMGPDDSKTWFPLHLWATPDWGPDTMSLAFEADPYFSPPADRSYRLELLFVPEDVTGAPEVGTEWEIPHDGPFVLTVPTFRSQTGKDSYRFSFTITPVPEPAGVVGLTIGALLLHRGCRRRVG